MLVTCPACRHAIEAPEGEPVKCPNCGDAVAAQDVRVPVSASGVPAGPRLPATPPDRPGLVGDAPRETTASGDTPDEAEAGIARGVLSDAKRERPPEPVTRPASIVALVCGLLFFIPIATQVAALGFGLVAVLRRRRKRERVAAAWVGIVVAALALCGWIFLFQTAFNQAAGPRWTWTPPPMSPIPADAANRPAVLRDQMERVFIAAKAYRRDYAEWPPDVASLVGRSLPNAFDFADELRYRPVPEELASSFCWALIVSAPLEFDLNGAQLRSPRRLVLWLDGEIEQLEEDEFDERVPVPQSGEESTEVNP